MTRSKIVVALALLFAAPAAAAAPKDPVLCDGLAKVRDGDLFKQWDQATKKAAIYANERADFIKIRADLVSDTTWAQSDWAVLTGMVAANIKTITGLINNLLAFAPAGGIVSATENAIVGALEGVELAQAVREDGAGYAISVYLGAQLHPVGKAYKAASDLASDIKRGIWIPQKRNELRKEVKTRLDTIDAALARNGGDYQKWSDRAKQLNLLKEAIDAFSLKYCR